MINICNNNQMQECLSFFIYGPNIEDLACYKKNLSYDFFRCQVDHPDLAAFGKGKVFLL